MDNFLTDAHSATSKYDFSPLCSMDTSAARWQQCELVLSKLRTVYGLKESDPVYSSLRDRFSQRFPQCASLMNASQTSDNQNTPVVVTASHFYPSGGASGCSEHMANGYAVVANNTSTATSNNGKNNSNNIIDACTDNNNDDDDNDNDDEDESGSNRNNEEQISQ